jgi:acyl-[acyl carrier protein]--UDP-N-acetylglucosamine O-acyltransferase
MKKNAIISQVIVITKVVATQTDVKINKMVVIQVNMKINKGVKISKAVKIPLGNIECEKEKLRSFFSLLEIAVFV